ncbi:hypothetical protein [Arthrobacter sp. ov118]|uniref:hypothetical protein n=1 Tax=Arthrobacter sp. ov118 TaxID=1761747 RepID=UPI0011605DEE|nr:hypothetical protein [Arthrobacter sp. ov118]
MPPKRRRLVGWGLLWFLLLGSVLRAAGIPEPWQSILAVVALAAVFGPLIRSAVKETQRLRDEGIDLPSYPVTRKSLISVGIITGLLWALVVVLVAIGRPVIPLLPIACTVWLAVQFRRWRALSG